MRPVFRVPVLLMLFCLAACGGGASLRDEKSSQEFSLRVLDESIQGDTSAQYYLDVKEQAGEREISLYARDAKALKALYVELSYDAGLWHIEDCAPAPAFGENALHLAAPAGPGLLQYGQVLADYEQRDGYSGSGKLATLRFAAGPAEAVQAAVKSPSASGPLVALSWEPGRNTLSWPYGVAGDYDQNGEVNIADLSPLGKYFGQAGPFGATDLRSQVDGDANGEINLADLTPIGAGFGNAVESYQVYFAQTEASLPQPGKEDSGGLIKGEPEFAAALGAAASERLRFEFPFGAAAPNGWVWVRPRLKPAEGGSFDGAASEVLRLGSAVVENELPVAALSADVLSGPAPLTVNFDASASSDPDGSLSAYEWDWTGGDDGWSWESSPGPLAAHTFDADGSYSVALRVTDNSGASAFAYQTINVQGVLNLPPTGTLDYGDSVLRKGHRVRFEVLDVDDPEGDWVTVDWDLNGDGDFYPLDAYRKDPEFETYHEVGDYYPSVRLEDNRGASAIVSLHIYIAEDLPPQADLTASPLTGSAPREILFDASASTDDFSNGVDGIMTLSWSVKCLSNGSLSHEAYTTWAETGGLWTDKLLAEGDYEVTVKVSDAAGQDSEDSVSVSLSGQSLHTSSYDSGSADFLDGAMISGRPAVVYSYMRSVDGVLGKRKIYYARALDDLGETWGPPVLLDDDLGLIGGNCSMLELEGNPAVSYCDYNGQQTLYVRALDPDGNAWTDPLVLAQGVTIGWGPSDLAIVGGLPAVLCANSTHIIYRSALDPLGDSWGEPGLIYEATHPGWSLSLCDVGGNPAALYFDLSHIHYTRAADSTGQVWPEALTLYDWNSNSDDCMAIQLSMVGGQPACSFSGMFIRANDPLGAEWPNAEALTDWQFRSSFCLIDGRLVVLANKFDAWLVYADDTLGSNWQAPDYLLDCEYATDLIDMGGFPGIFHDTSFSTLY